MEPGVGLHCDGGNVVELCRLYDEQNVWGVANEANKMKCEKRSAELN